MTYNRVEGVKKLNAMLYLCTRREYGCRESKVFVFIGNFILLGMSQTSSFTFTQARWVQHEMHSGKACKNCQS